MVEIVMAAFKWASAICWLLLISGSVWASSISQTLEEKNHTMDITDIQKTFEWLTFVKESTVAKTPCNFEVKDELNRSILIEWKASDILSPDLAEFKQSIANIAAKTLAPTEVLFLKAFPKALSHEMFLKPCIPLFANGLEKVNWVLVEETIESSIKQFYLADLSKFGMEMIKPLLNDVYLFSTIKDKETHTILGFMICSITPALPNGDVKLINLVVVDEEQNKGLEKLLLSSIFTIIPQIKRIFCFARPTNTSALTLYQNLGFTKDLYSPEDPNHKVDMNYLIRLQYKTDESDILQDNANLIGDLY